MKRFETRIKAEVNDFDEDVIRTIPRAITQRFSGTAVRIEKVIITQDETAVREEATRDQGPDQVH